MLEVNFLFVDHDVELVFEFVGNAAARDGAEGFAFLAGLHLHHTGQLGNAFGQFTHGVELVGFALGATLPECFEPPLVAGAHGNRQTLWVKIITRVPGGDFDLVGFRAQPDNVVSEDNFSFCHSENDRPFRAVPPPAAASSYPNPTPARSSALP